MKPVSLAAMRCFLLLLCLSSLSVQAGDVWYRNADTLNRKRLLLTGGGQALVWSGSLLALNQAWYAQYPRTSFHLYNDAAEWMQVDKAGHAFSACWSAQLSASLFRWSGISPRRSAWYGAAMGIAYESVIEILDGFSQKWGFSIWDMASNTSGSLFFALQQHYWQEQRIDFRFSSHIIRYPESELQARANELYGQRLPERILKDYNAQTYWLSFNLKSFARSTSIPAWLNIAVGYGAQGLLGGMDNLKRDDLNQIVYASPGIPAFDRRDIPRYRQWYLAPDIDLSRIRIHGKTPAVFRVVQHLHLKFPLPGLEWSTQNGLRAHWIFF